MPRRIVRKLSAIKWAPIWGAFFFAAVLTACTKAASKLELFNVKRVIDGDTLVLESGQAVRFIGVNTPELGHGKFKDEPFAKRAKKFVKRKIQGKQVELRLGQEGKDRHGRLLAHIFTDQGENIQIGLLERGLAYVVAIGDNFGFLDEYLKAEQGARKLHKGIWGDNFYAAISAKKASSSKQRGYKRVVGLVEKVSRSKKNQILHLKGGFRVLIRRDNWRRYFKGKAKHYIGQKIQVRGWVFKSHGITGVKIYHPSMIEVLAL